MEGDAAEPNEKIVRNEGENTPDPQRAGQKRKRSHNKERQKSANIQIDRALIPTVPLQETFVGERLTNLSDLGVSAYRPEEMEKNVMEQVRLFVSQDDLTDGWQVDRALASQKEEKEQSQLRALRNQMAELESFLTHLGIPKDPLAADEVLLDRSVKVSRDYRKVI